MKSVEYYELYKSLVLKLSKIIKRLSIERLKRQYIRLVRRNALALPVVNSHRLFTKYFLK